MQSREQGQRLRENRSQLEVGPFSWGWGGGGGGGGGLWVKSLEKVVSYPWGTFAW